MPSRFYAVIGVILLATAFASAQTTTEGRTLQVQAAYSGSGTVDADHKIAIVLWDSPDFMSDTPSGPPIEVKFVDSKDGTATFTGIQKSPVYVSAAYDPTGKWDAQSGPPPSGSSLGLYNGDDKESRKPAPIEVAPGKTVKIKVAFDDSAKMP